MDARIKALWLTALRDLYKQGRGRMRRGDEFCCLGVLCDLHAKEGRGQWQGDGYLTANHAPAYGLPPPEVYRWAGLVQGTKLTIGEGVGTGVGKHTVLSEHNDNGKTFAQIADAIEREL